MKPIDKTLEAFKLADLQTFRNIIIVLEQNEQTIDAALRYVRYRTVGQMPMPYRQCPECGEGLYLYPVNTTYCDRVGHRFKSQWYCHACDHSELSRLSVPHQMHKLKTSQMPELDDKTKKLLLDIEIGEFLKRPLHANCPVCDELMFLYPVTTPLGKANIKGYKSVWFCDHCAYDKYLKHDVREEAIRLRRI